MVLNKCFAKIKPYFTAPSDPSPRNNNFNIIRVFASLLVIYGHMSHIMGLPVFTVYNQAISTIGVKIFFVISGYLITKSFMNDSNFIRYMIRRVFRIFPGLIAVTLFAFLIIGPLMTELSVKEYFNHPEAWLYLKNMILWPIYNLPETFKNNIYPYAINGSLWSLPVEFAMYLILPIVYVIFKKLNLIKVGIIGTALLFVIINYIKITFFPEFRFVFYGTNWPDGLSLVPFFFIGSLFSLPQMNKYLNLQLSTALFVAGAFFSFDLATTEILLTITLPYFVLSFALCDKPVFGAWFKKCDFSYGLYLYGFPIQQILFNYIRTRMDISLNMMTLISFIFILIISILSWYLVEKPCQKLGQKIVKKLSNKNTN